MTDRIPKIDAYLDGELDPSALAAFEALRASDPEFSELVEEESALRLMLTERLVEAPPVGVRARVAQTLDREDSPRRAPAPVPATGSSGRGRTFRFAYAAAVVLLAVGLFFMFGNDPADDATEEPYSATAALFEVHDSRASLPGTAFDTRDAVAETFLRMPAPDLCELGWNFHRGVSGKMPKGRDDLVWVRYTTDGGREFSLVMAKGDSPTRDTRIPVGPDEFHVEKRDDGLVGVFWREPSGIVCGVVATAEEEELRFLAASIRLQGG